jgi:hypothetical protein
VFVSLWVWVRHYFPHPTEGFEKSFVFGLACFPVCVLVGRVSFCPTGMLDLMYSGWDEGGKYVGGLFSVFKKINFFYGTK